MSMSLNTNKNDSKYKFNMNINQTIDYLKIFLPYINLLVFALTSTATIIDMIPNHWVINIWLSIPKKYIQNAGECHLLALYILKSPTNCSK